MKLEKLSKKVLGRKMTMFEIYSVISGIIVAVFSIIKGNGNYVPLVFGFSILILIVVFIKNKQKNMVLLSMISLLGWLLILNVAAPTLLTTTFSTSTSEPINIGECNQMGGVCIPLNQQCPSTNNIEYGKCDNYKKCCVEDRCLSSGGKYEFSFSQKNETRVIFLQQCICPKGYNEINGECTIYA